MYIVLGVVLFLALTTALFAFGAATLAPASVLGTRLRRLMGASVEEPPTTSIKDRLERALDPISKALP